MKFQEKDVVEQDIPEIVIRKKFEQLWLKRNDAYRLYHAKDKPQMYAWFRKGMKWKP